MARAEAGLIRTLQAGRDLGSRALAAAALGNHCSEPSRQALIHALDKDRHDAVRISAVQALRHYGCKMGVKGRATVAQALLQDRSAQVRSGAALALGGLGSSATEKEVSIICDALRKERHSLPVRAACAQTLGWIFKAGGQLAAAALTHAFWNDGDKSVRSFAAESLQKMAVSLIRAGAIDLARRIQAVLSSPETPGQLSHDWLMPDATHWNHIAWNSDGCEKVEISDRAKAQSRRNRAGSLPGRWEGSQPQTRPCSSSAAARREGRRTDTSRPFSSPGTESLPQRWEGSRPLSRTMSLPSGWERHRRSANVASASSNREISRSQSFVDHFPGPPGTSAGWEADDFDLCSQQAALGRRSHAQENLESDGEHQRPTLMDFDRTAHHGVSEQRSVSRSQAVAAWPKVPMPWTYPAKGSTLSRGWRSHTIRSVTHDVSDVQCEVCLQDLVPGQELRVLPCLHQYHVLCIDEWCDRCRARGTPPTCPICRAVVTAPQRPSTSPC
eukprot:gnl/MRDRNA2_/MRDRNA2_107671_c0_seq1.p1 gnl/MRDRNA2_/MRDRNA2_107671_c0~~gnl/MRDRNA2_/MRDRNA2_107671_c0_seq1.p1  ORF type:complete len:524 (+),score=56.88 gnl/MRDRNA2_/MRDRNA2_107671_c0_seq1:73-1572(+)